MRDLSIEFGVGVTRGLSLEFNTLQFRSMDIDIIVKFHTLQLHH